MDHVASSAHPTRSHRTGWGQRAGTRSWRLVVALACSTMVLALGLVTGSAVSASATSAVAPSTSGGLRAPEGVVTSSISAGGYHSCGVRTNGTVACWGDNGKHQAEAPAGTFTTVAAGGFHSCGVRTDGTVDCWGWNVLGQATDPAGTYTALAAGGFHTCGVRTNGTLDCWGDDTDGQATEPAGTYAAVTAGHYHSCGVKTDGTTLCWGENTFGQASNPAGTFTTVTAGGAHTCGVRTDATIHCWGYNLSLQASDPDGTFTTVAAGLYYTCGLRTDGTIHCWGDNTDGQATDPVGTYTALTAGGLHSCGVRTNGTIHCWGYNSEGQATDPAGTFSSRAVSAGGYHTCGVRTDGTIDCWGAGISNTPTTPEVTFTAVSAGEFHACGLETDATVQCWGTDTDGQATDPAGTYTTVTAGGSHTCGLKTDATIHCWGDNTHGQATDPTGTYTTVTAGGLHTCGLRTDATIHCWGYNAYGQATDPTGTYTTVTAGGAHTCGLKADATTHCWGYNTSGQATGQAGTFTTLTAGTYHSCGLKTDATIHCWGQNTSGQATDPTGTFATLSAGGTHTCGVRTGGTIACWGWNFYGQLGPASSTPAPAPAPSNGLFGTAYTHTFTSSGSPASTFRITDGALPTGLVLSAAGVLSGTPTVAGTFTFTVTASNGLFADASAEFTLTIADPNVAPKLVINPADAALANQSVQYSDAIRPVHVTATDANTADTLTLTATGLPTGVTFTDNHDKTGVLTGTATVAAGTYVVTLTATDPAGLTSTQKVTLTVTAEAATVGFATGNPQAVQVSLPGGDSGQLTLTTTITETTPDTAAGTAHPGDINKATTSMTLAPVGPGSPVVGTCTPASVDPVTGYADTLTVNCSFDDVPVNTYTAEVSVTGGYYTGSGEDALTVFDPSLGFTTGGGSFTWPGTTDRTTFGYSMKYTSKRTSLKGSLLVIRHLSDGTVYRVKSNALSGLSLGQGEGFGWATFTGKATYREPTWADAIGNHTFTAYAEDHSTSGKDQDRFWLQVKQGKTTVTLSMPTKATTNAATLTGGNILVPN